MDQGGGLDEQRKKGQEEVKYLGLEGRVFQHEYDHLDGKVCSDRLSETSATCF